MSRSRDILILGASYGSLPAVRLLMAGHRVRLVCTAETAALVAREGVRVRFPARDGSAPLEVASRALPGELTASAPEATDPRGFDLVVLAMQEAHYAAPTVRALLARIARERVPCLAIMNMPPPPYLARLGALDMAALESCYADASVWRGFDPALVTLASPDPQAFRPAGEPKNVLEVGLATNFKAARFDAEAPTALLRELEADIEASRLERDGVALELPVKLKVHESRYVPLAKWPMLIAGNYRSIRADGMVSIREAVHGDLERSRAIYEWVARLCLRLGAAESDLVPFDKYARAAESLVRPSSAARALFAGAEHIERVDLLVQRIGAQFELRSAALDEIVARVEALLARNRARSAVAGQLAAAVG
ncbi:MAG: hypothetical protein RML56_12370 [Burkholderiales bacterium]|nr:hypothetical protein [Burkholderiales bacterium]